MSMDYAYYADLLAEALNYLMTTHGDSRAHALSVARVTLESYEEAQISHGLGCAHYVANPHFSY